MMLVVMWLLWLAVNVGVFSLYGADKRRARQGRWRIPERVLLLGALCMGGVGAWMGMKVFRHKTKHAVFRAAVPTLAVISMALMAAASLKFMRIL